MDNQRNDDWFVISPDSDPCLTQVYQGFLKDIIKRASTRMYSYEQYYIHELHIDNTSPFCKTVTLKHPIENDDYFNFVWKFYRAKFYPDTGLSWVKFTKWTEVWWNLDIEELKLDACYRVFINGEPMIPKNKKVYFCVEFFNRPTKDGIESSWQYEGYQLFENHYQLACSLNDWFIDGDVSFFQSASCLSSGMLEVDYIKDGDFCINLYSRMLISRVWFDEMGKKVQAPWVTRHRKVVEESLNKSRFNKSRLNEHGIFQIVHVLPQEMNFILPDDDYYIPPMVPNDELLENFDEPAMENS